jgi:hypothetical protein
MRRLSKVQPTPATSPPPATTQHMSAPRLSREESRDSYQSLQELEPSPVDETPVEYSNESYFPDRDKEGHSTPPFGVSTLGLGNHGPAFYRMCIDMMYG